MEETINGNKSETPGMTLIKKFQANIQKTAFRDILFLVSIIFILRILYLFNLGFYSDDWNFFELFYFKDKTVIEWYRPFYMLSWYLMYSVLGLTPAGYHLLNTIIFFLVAALLYINLTKLKLPRLFALSIPLLFILLPHYSTIHFWASVIPNHLCLALLLVSLFADLKALESDLTKLILWKLVSIFAIAASALTYELFLPFFYLNLLLTYYQYKKLLAGKDGSRSLAINPKKIFFLILTNFLFLKIALIYKLFFTKTSARMMGNESSISEHMYWLLVNVFRLDYNEYDYGLNIKQAVKINFVDYGIELPSKLSTIFNHYQDKTIFLVGIIVGFLVFSYLYIVVKKHEFSLYSLKTSGKLILAGVIIFITGYSIFLTNYNIAFTATGIGNRVSIGAALGIAVIWLGIITGLSGKIRNEDFRNIFFSLLIALISASGFIINNTISTFWVNAYKTQEVVLEEIKHRFPSLPDSTTLMLDGVCPYDGPAIVFESSWDLAGALRVIYSNRSLKGDIITPTLKVTESGFITTLYEADFVYPYDLIIYNYSEKEIFRISNKKEALEYFEQEESNYNGNCPYGHEAHGVAIF